MEWHVSPEHADEVGDFRGRTATTRDLELSDEQGDRTPFHPLLDAQLREDYGAVAHGSATSIGRSNTFDAPTWLHGMTDFPLPVTGWTWSVDVVSWTDEIVTDAVGDMTAELVLRSIDGDIHHMVTQRDILAWTFDGKTVVPSSDIER